MNYITRVTRLTVLPEKEPIFSEKATHIKIDDEAAGEFVKISQVHDHSEPGTICITHEEWPLIRDAVEQLLSDIAQ